MSFRQKSKHLPKLQERFVAQVLAYLATKGAQPSRFYQLELQTPAGLLLLSIHESWIACRFEDVRLGRLFTACCGRHCNPYSGKWNFHYATDETLDPAMALADFRYYLDQLLGWRAELSHAA